MSSLRGSANSRAIGCPAYPSAVRSHRLRRRASAQGTGHEPDQGQSALLVAVPEAGALVRTIGDRALVADDLPPHITVLFPFLPPSSLDPDIIDRLRVTIAEHPSFTFSLNRVDTFPGVVWLAPDPPRPFHELTDSVVRGWPDLIPYNDPSLEAVAHLTVGRGRLRRRWRHVIEAALPIEARATDVLLMAEQSGAWREHARFPLAHS